MKKALIFSLVLLSVASVSFYGCKKGDEDPFLSFRSRKGRIAGVWKVTEYSENGIDSIARTTISPLSDACGTYTVTVTDGRVITFEFNKDGSFKQVNSHSITYNKKYDVPTATCLDVSVSTDDTLVKVRKGLWQFGGGVGAYKSKEQLITTDGEDHVYGVTYDIIKCTKKELKLEQAITRFDTSSAHNDTVTVYRWTLERQGESDSK